MRRASKLAAITPVAVLALLAGCNNTPSTGTGGATTAPATSAAPATVGVGVLVAAAAKSVAQPFHLRMDVDVAGQATSLTGDVNPATGELTLSSTGPIVLQILVSGSDAYVKSPAFAALNIPNWLHLDLAKLRPNSSLRQGLNPVATLGMLAGATNITQTSPGNYRGTLDLSVAAQAVPDADAKTVLTELMKQAGDAAKSVPFTAQVDTEGRLTSFSTDMVVAGTTLKSAMVLSDFGAAVTVTRPPAAEVTEAPAEVYQAI